MAASIPEGTWIFIVILAVIILAILSNDSISRSGSSSRSGSDSSSDSTNPSGDSPRATTDDPDSSKNPIVKVTEANYDPDAERLRLKAEARSRSDAEIALTGFVMLSFAGDGFRAPNLQNSREVSSGPQHILETSLEIPEDKIDAGVVQYRAKTKDTGGRTGTQEGSFPLKASVPDGSSDADGTRTPINIDISYGGSDSGTEDDSGSPSSSDGEDSSTGGDDESGGDSDGSDLKDDENRDYMSAADDIHGLEAELQEELQELKNAIDDVKGMEEGHEEEINLEERLERQLEGLIGDLNQIYKDEQQIRNVISEDSMDATSAMERGDLNSSVSDLKDLVDDAHRRLSKIQDIVDAHDTYEHKTTNMDEKFNRLINEASDHEGDMEEFAEQLGVDLGR